jgi:hypothetical protein
MAHVHHRIYPHALIRINNADTHCLFYALQATMMQKTMNWARNKFARYLHGEYGMRGQLKNNVLELMRAVGAQPNQQHYDATMWVPKVVEHWNRVHAGRFIFKVFIFGPTGNYKPKQISGPDVYNTPIVLYHDNFHFDGVNKLGALFGERYCLACLKPFSREQEHTMKCRERCHQCSRVGPTFPRQCQRGSLNDLKCSGCNKTFLNNDCYQHHLRSGFCRNNKECPNCHIFYNVKDVKRG